MTDDALIHAIKEGYDILLNLLFDFLSAYFFVFLSFVSGVQGIQKPKRLQPKL